LQLQLSTAELHSSCLARKERTLVLESLTFFMMLGIASLFVFLYRMDRNQRRKQAAEAKEDQPGSQA
jgi:hypothetical protein